MDHTCIDCDTCRWMQPDVYQRVNGQTAVVDQPVTDEEKFRAAQALLACPTHSIHMAHSKNGELQAAAKSFPTLIEGAQRLYHCGYHSESSFGAASYFVERQDGNILVDSPRFDKSLLKNIKALGGAKYMFLTHRDDVADHARWAKELGLQRIIHKTEANRSQGTNECEIQLEGEGPWRLPGDAEDVEIILTPGHTQGHIVLLYKDTENPEETACFTGDHLAFSRLGGLSIFKNVNWYSVKEQVKSVAKIKDKGFLRILPGHGRPGIFESDEERQDQLGQLLAAEGFKP